MKRETRNAKFDRNPVAAARRARLRSAFEFGNAFAIRIAAFSCPRHGFTLLELLLAVAIFALVLLAMHVMFFGALRLRNQTATALDEALPLQQALAVLRRDLAHVLPPGGTLAGAFQSNPTTTGTNLTSDTGLGLGGRRVSPDLYTASALLEEQWPWSEVQKVAYWLIPATNASPGLELVRTVTRNLLPAFDEPPEVQSLLGGVEEVVFEYFDGSTWRDAWDSTVELTPLPLAVRVQIELRPPPTATIRPAPVELLVPLVMQARTNQTDLAAGAGGGT